jgi:hypothetical protein
MLFVITYSFDPSARNTAQDRFRKTGGLPGAGVKLHGRWHAIAGNRGFLLAESGDSVAIGKWMQEWTDILRFEVVPVNSDEDVMKVIGA